MVLVAPYSYSWSLGNTSSYAIPDLKTAMQKIGLKAATWAFLVGNGSGGVCYDYTNDLADLKAFTAAGNTLIISLGGASGPYLEPSVSQAQLTQILEQTLQDTGAYGFDFDVEGAAIADTATIDKRNKAIAALQAKHPGLYISYTLATQTPAWGSLTADAIALLKNAVSNGVQVSVVNGMIMDLYNAALFAPPATFGSIAIQVLESMKAQIAPIWPQKSTAELYATLGATIMLGVNDDHSTFQVPDAEVLTDYAIKNQIGLLSWWSLQRDQASQSGGLATSSLIPQDNFAFYNVFKAASSGTPPPPSSTGGSTSDPPPAYTAPPPTTTPPSTTPSSGSSPSGTWADGVSYEKGNIVTFDGNQYTCLQPHVSQNDWKPDEAFSLWQNDGPAPAPSAPPTTTTPPTTTPPTTTPPTTTPPTTPSGPSTAAIESAIASLQAVIASLQGLLSASS